MKKLIYILMFCIISQTAFGAGSDSSDSNTYLDKYKSAKNLVNRGKKLEEKGLAYESNGSVYFDLTAYKAKFKYNLLRPETSKNETILEGEVVNADKKKTHVIYWNMKASELWYKFLEAFY